MSTDTMDQTFLSIPNKAIIASLILHVGGPLLLVTLKIMPFDLSFLTGRDSKKIVYQDFIQVDMVALPDLTPDQMKNIETHLPIMKNVAIPAKAAEEKEAVKDDSEGIEFSSKIKEVGRKLEKEKAKADQLKKVESQEREKAIQKLKAQADRDAALHSLATIQGRPALPGNVTSEGNSTSGNIGTERDKYIALLTKAIRDRFSVYPWQKKMGVSASLYLEISTRGEIIRRELTRRSTDARFDSNVLKAIDDAKSFPVPEDPSIIAGGIQIEFSP